jgi:hypothetical protein
MKEITIEYRVSKIPDRTIYVEITNVKIPDRTICLEIKNLITEVRELKLCVVTEEDIEQSIADLKTRLAALPKTVT